MTGNDSNDFSFAQNNPQPVFSYLAKKGTITYGNMACVLGLDCATGDVVNLETYKAGTYAYRTGKNQKVIVPSGDRYFQIEVAVNPKNREEILCYGSDVTSLMKDKVTGFLNEKGFRMSLDGLISKKEQCSVVQFRIDKLRQVRRYGFQADDELAKQISERFYDCSCGKEGIVAARVEKDTFYMMIPGATKDETVGLVKEHLIDIINDTYNLGFGELFTEGKISIVDSRSISHDDPDKVNTLFKYAERAYILAQEHPDLPFVVYDEESSLVKNYKKEEAVLETIVQALDPKNERVKLVPFWHGVYDVPEDYSGNDYRELMCQKEDGEQGEILARIAIYGEDSTEPQIIPPGVFIDVAEKKGRINELTIALIKEVYKRCDEIYVPDGDRKLKKLHINLSPYQLSSNGLIDVIRKLETHNGFPGRDKITWEITETLYGDPEKVAKNTRLLKELGYSTALDDFGEGLSTANRIKELGEHLDDIKVDRMQTKDLEAESRIEQIAAQDFIRAAVTRSKVFDAEVVVEGVETARMIDRARDVGAKKFQGFLFSPPWEFR